MTDPVKSLLFDIEGTTTSLSFVHDVLFPESRDRLPSFLEENWSEEKVKAQVANLEESLGKATGSLTAVEAADILVGFINEDRKVPALKSLQGMIWKDAYESGRVKSHLYPEVADALRMWHGQGLQLAIYSSGSILAQKLLFRYTEEGDLTPLLSGYFDTTTGPKKESASYANIAAQLGQKAGEILFFSDNLAELDAASAAGMQTVQLQREEDFPEGSPTGDHQVVESFHSVKV